MRRPSLGALLVGLTLLSACKVVEHVPPGHQRDEAEIRDVLARYFEGRSKSDSARCADAVLPGAKLTVGSSLQSSSRPPSVIPIDLLADCRSSTLPFGPLARDSRMARADIKADRGLASAWITTLSRPAQSGVGEVEGAELVVLFRIRDRWRISSVAIPSGDGR